MLEDLACCRNGVNICTSDQQIRVQKAFAFVMWTVQNSNKLGIRISASLFPILSIDRRDISARV